MFLDLWACDGSAVLDDMLKIGVKEFQVALRCDRQEAIRAGECASKDGFGQGDI